MNERMARIRANDAQTTPAIIEAGIDGSTYGDDTKPKFSLRF
jgi:hypothetical protein